MPNQFNINSINIDSVIIPVYTNRIIRSSKNKNTTYIDGHTGIYKIKTYTNKLVK